MRQTARRHTSLSRYVCDTCTTGKVISVGAAKLVEAACGCVLYLLNSPGVVREIKRESTSRGWAESDVYRCQILTSNLDPRAVGVYYICFISRLNHSYGE